jgi:hypothetical protein
MGSVGDDDLSTEESPPLQIPDLLLELHRLEDHPRATDPDDVVA